MRKWLSTKWKIVKPPCPHPRHVPAKGLLPADPFAWLQNPRAKVGNEPRLLAFYVTLLLQEVQEYLKSENDYAEQVMTDTIRLQRQLLKEMKQVHSSVTNANGVAKAEAVGEWAYYSKNPPGKHFAVHYRYRVDNPNEEQVVLDVNDEVKEFDFIHVSTLKVSLNHKYLAYTRDTTGKERFELLIRDIATKKTVDHILSATSVEWAVDSNTIFYTVPDALNRPHQVYRHVIGSDPSKDVLVYEEKNDSFFLDLLSTKDKKFVTITCNSKTTSEVHYIPSSNPTTPPQLFRKRQNGVEYYVDHTQDKFFVVTNTGGQTEMEVMWCSENDTTKWHPFVPFDQTIKIEDVDLFKDYMVLYERHSGLPKIRVISFKDSSSSQPSSPAPSPSPSPSPSVELDGKRYEEHYVEFPSPFCFIEASANIAYDTDQLRFHHSTPIMPEVTYSYSMKSRVLTPLTKTSFDGYDISKYECERHMVPNDGVEVPLTIIHKKGTTLNHNIITLSWHHLITKFSSNPLLMVTYGAYGVNTETSFHVEYIPLINRGWIIALAHVRGGGELGRLWHVNGKQLNKMNTFKDFIACAEYLHGKGYSKPSLTAATAASAGGLILGAVCNTRADLWRSMVVKVPFVDVLTIMTDPTMPLTLHEYDEWGNPTHQQTFQHIKQYQNVKKRMYPSLFVTSSLHDQRVPYWAPVKWFAKIRHNAIQHPSNTNEPNVDENEDDDNRLFILKTSEDSGHFGEGGNIGYYHETARDFAFLIMTMGLINQETIAQMKHMR